MKLLLSDRIFALSWIRDSKSRRVDWLTERATEMAALTAEIYPTPEAPRLVDDALSLMKIEIIAAMESDEIVEAMDHACEALLQNARFALATNTSGPDCLRRVGAVIDRMKNLAAAVDDLRNPAR